MKRFITLFDAAGDQGSGGGGGQGGGTLMDGGSGGGQQQQQGGGSGGGGQQQQQQGGGGGGGSGDGGTAVPYWRGLYNEDGTLNHGAFDRLPDHLKPAAETFRKYKNVDALLGAAWHSFTLNGKKGLMPLDPNAPPEAKAEFKARLRELLKVPGKPEEYGIQRPAELPESLWDDEYVNNVLKVLHDHDAPPELVQALVKADTEHARARFANMQTEALANRQKAVQALQTEFGNDFTRKVALSKQVAVMAGLDPKNPAIGDNPDLIRAFARIGELLGEDTLHKGGDGGGSGGAKTPGQLATDIINNKANPDHEAYHSSSHPNHRAAVQKVLEFNRQEAARKRQSSP